MPRELSRFTTFENRIDFRRYLLLYPGKIAQVSASLLALASFWLGFSAFYFPFTVMACTQ
jgi:hypothetical protein